MGLAAVFGFTARFAGRGEPWHRDVARRCPAGPNGEIRKIERTNLCGIGEAANNTIINKPMRGRIE
jgi:hypothetical protein